MQSSCPMVGVMDEKTWGSDDPLGKERRSCFKEAADSEDSPSPSPDSDSRAGLKTTPESCPRGGASQLLRCAAACRRDPRQCPDSPPLKSYPRTTPWRRHDDGPGDFPTMDRDRQ